MKRADAALLWNTIAQDGGGASSVSALGGAALASGAPVRVAMKLDSGGGLHVAGDGEAAADEVAAFLRGWAGDLDGTASEWNRVLEQEPDKFIDAALERLVATVGHVRPGASAVLDAVKMLSMLSSMRFGSEPDAALTTLGAIWARLNPPR
jgi:hypothetical protein